MFFWGILMQYHIVSGPSKFDLMISLMFGDSRHRVGVRFSLKPEIQIETTAMKVVRIDMDFMINRTEREDGSGERWNILGVREGKPMKGFYDTQTRQGHLEY